MGDVPNTPQERTEPVDGWNQRSVRLPLPATSLTDLVRLAAQPANAPMSMSLVTRTQFSRDYLLRRLLASVTRRSEEHTSELQSLMRISYAVYCLKNKINAHALVGSGSYSSQAMQHETSNKHIYT